MEPIYIRQIEELAKRYARAVSDLEEAAFGHLGGGDWDKEMREALGEVKKAREAIKANRGA